MATTPTPAKRFPLHPARPERTCWGCDRYCAAGAMLCGNGSVRAPHPVELFGDDWAEWAGAVDGADKTGRAVPEPDSNAARDSSARYAHGHCNPCDDPTA